jgi:poly-gamma-glutamate capsule biosynthesis protein CapA/YwtB (metallophosphatase superfamily)
MLPTQPHRSRRTFPAAMLAVRLLALPLAAQVAPPAAAPPPATPAVTLTMALTGDSIITQHLTPYREPEFLKLIDLIRGADVAFTNIEMLFHNYEGYPSVVSGGTYMRADPEMAKDLAWAGFDLGSRANNHAGDYTLESLFSTDRALTAAGIVYAGTGDNLQQAREARFVDTAGGRVALVSCASTFTPHSVAGRQRSDMKGRPGLSPLRFETKYTVDADTLAQLRALAGKLGGGARGGGGRGGRGGRGGEDEVTFQGNHFVLGEKFGMVRTPLKQDLDEIAAAVSDAKTMARHVIVSLHCHEADPVDRNAPPDFFIAFAHAMVDAGASAVVGEGPHVLHGIEIYKGKVICYSLGDFIMQNDTVLRQPQENYDSQGLGLEARVGEFNDKRSAKDTRGYTAQREPWESVVAMPKFEGEKLVELKLVPITLGFGSPAGVRGRPVLASADDGKKIIADLVKMSAPLGTKIENRDGVGVVLLLP